jgi:isopentenyl-diphosphate delta-isomerase
LAEGTSGATDQWKELRAEFPELILFANLGLSQLPGAFTTDVARVVESIRAQALVVHANALQEALQPEGTPQFKGGVAALARLTRELTVPVVLKETGCGFSKNTMLKLRETGLSALDVSGLGGTHWGRIEGARARVADPIRGGAAETFAQWGESTVQSLLTAHELCPELELWGSGGVRSGLDAAKAIALGAHRVGYAQPALAAALQGDEALSLWMEQQEYELKLALFCTGMRDPLALRSGNGLWKTNGN